LIDINVDAARGHIHFGPHLSGVLAPRSERSAAARHIATTVAGPRPDDAGGRVELDGRACSVWALPAEVLPPGVPPVVDHEIVLEQWRAAWARRRDEIAAAHASCRLEGYRIDAALERALDRLPLASAPTRITDPHTSAAIAPATPQAPAPAAVGHAPEPDGPPPPVDWTQPPDASTRTRSRLRTLLAALDAMVPEPMPEGAFLADAWDAHRALVRARAAMDALPPEAAGPSVPELEERVNAARLAVAQAPRETSDEARAEIDRAHRAVGEAEAAVFNSKRRRQTAARARHEQARAEEAAALAAAGFSSYAAYLFEVTGGSGASGLATRLAAETELAAARGALDAARRVPAVPTRLDLAEREVQMRARAADLLGHAPGPDPTAELRALVVAPVGRDDKIAEIADVLRHGGVPVGDDPAATARAYLSSSTAVPSPTPTASPKRPRVADAVAAAAAAARAAYEGSELWTEPPASGPAGANPADAAPSSHAPAAIGAVDPGYWPEVADLEEQRAAGNRKLAQCEAELARVDAIMAAGKAPLAGADLVIAIEATVGAYRAGRLLGGYLPLVLDGVLDGLDDDVRDAALAVFARSTDVQTVVVTDDPEVMQSLSREGGTLVRWPDRIVNLVEEEAAELAPAPYRS
jgi:hypothetical protein